jgi:drug/metabolite transporter, DME family
MAVSVTASPAGRRASRSHLLFLVLSGLLWGTGGLTGTEFGHLTGLSPLAVAACRLLAGGGLIVVVRTVALPAGRPAGRRWPAGRAAWIRIAATGLLAAAFQGCYFSAVSLTSVSLATLVTISGSPVIVLVAERIRGRGDRGTAGTSVLALCGLGLLVGLPSGGFGYTAVLASAGLAALAAAGFATMTLLGASPVPGLDDLTVTGFGFALGGLVLVPFATLTGLAFRPAPAAIGLLIALATGPTAVAYTLYFRGLRGAPPGTAALLALLEPLTATMLAALLLGERLSVPGLAGAALLLAAVLRTALRKQSPTGLRADRAVEVGGVPAAFRDLLHGLPGLRRVDDVAAADVDRDMALARVEQQVTRLERGG